MTVCRWGVDVGVERAASLGATAEALLARVGICGCCWREADGAIGKELAAAVRS